MIRVKHCLTITLPNMLNPANIFGQNAHEEKAENARLVRFVFNKRVPLLVRLPLVTWSRALLVPREWYLANP
jgi:hypothetical protein